MARERQRRNRHIIGRREALHIRDATERAFARAALDTDGVELEAGRSIKAPRPVRDRHGRERKRTTHPDFYITVNNRAVHVEVTNGRANSPSKRAQRRVARAARVENYVQLTGHEVQEFEDAPPETKLEVLKRLLHL